MTKKLLFPRLNEIALVEWWQTPSRKPLILRGARQVGKSTLVRSFAEKAGIKVAAINCERHPELEKVFANGKMEEVFSALEGILKAELPRDSSALLFLDEIQAVPSAISFLRYFYEELPSLPVIAAGSLLEFALSDRSVSMPVGRIQFHYLGPATFTEYLEARGETYFLKILDQYELGKQIAESAHTALLAFQREFLFVGGMPEAVQLAAQGGKAQKTSDALQSILDTYREDFGKYATRAETDRLFRVFSRIAAFLHKKVKYSAVDPEEQSRETKKTLQLLKQARLITPVYHSSGNGVPIEAEADFDVFKLLFLDVGLMNRLLDLSWSELEKLDERTLIHEGPLAEQFIGQSLLTAFSQQGRREPRLHYWLREGKASNAEVDYLISFRGKVVPIEVKSGKSGSLKSLIQFVHEKKCELAVRFDLNLPSEQWVTHAGASGASIGRFKLLSLPLYLADQLPRILNGIGDALDRPG